MLQKVVHRLEKLQLRLAEAEHEAALGGALGAHFTGHGLGTLQDMEAAGILRPAANERGEALHGLQVVIEDVRAGLHDHFEGIVFAVEVWHEDLDGDGGHGLADGLDGAGKVLRAAVFHVITGYGGDDDVVQSHAFRGLGHSLRLIGLQSEGLGRFHRAEAAGTCAAVSGDHEGGRALAPAFPAVRTLGLFADGVQLQIGDETLRAPEFRVTRQSYADPVRLFIAVKGGVDFRGH